MANPNTVTDTADTVREGDLVSDSGQRLATWRSAGTSPYPQKMYTLTHLPEARGQGGLIATTDFIPPSDTGTIVAFVSRLMPDTRQKIHSDAFLGAFRRRHASKLVQDVSGLAAHEAKEDLAGYTLPIVETLRRLILQLIDGEKEGNTREILRQVRDSLLNGGWERFRKETVRQVVVAILRRLAELEVISSNEVDNCWRELVKAGLHPLGKVLL